MRRPGCASSSNRPVPHGNYPVTGQGQRYLNGGLSTGPKTAEGRAAISAANTKHGRDKHWREKPAKERYYFGEIKRVMREAELAGLLVSK